uniref:Aminotransferase-like plant mobile domain-containing protein n=1 Tax=Quercus lobata TaxID=97700 RepID=A0A7N2LNE3_QUELO
MLKSAWAPLSPCIKNIINEVGFGTFFEVLLNHETHEYKDLQLLLALAVRFWDTTCTFHFPGIGEVMLTPYDFSVIISLRLGGKRILVNDSFTSTELKKLLGVVPSRMRSNNIPLSWLCENIPQCETVAKGARMFMLPFIGTFLCPDLGSIVNLHYLGSLRKIEQIRNYDWGGMAYATLMHFMMVV